MVSDESTSPARETPVHYMVLDDQQAAVIFRMGTRAWQFEDGRMRWWFDHGLLLNLVDGEWRLYVVPTRSGGR